MIKDLILDTHVLNEFICQYFENNIYADGYCIEKNFLTIERVKYINRIISEFRDESTFSRGLLITSALSFIEIARKFSNISNQRYNQVQFKSFLEEMPSYLHVAPVEKGLSFYLNKVPKFIIVNDEKKPIELADAIHIATFFSRDAALMLTDDKRIKNVPEVSIL